MRRIKRPQRSGRVGPIGIVKESEHLRDELLQLIDVERLPEHAEQAPVLDLAVVSLPVPADSGDRHSDSSLGQGSREFEIAHAGGDSEIREHQVDVPPTVLLRQVFESRIAVGEWVPMGAENLKREAQDAEIADPLKSRQQLFEGHGGARQWLNQRGGSLAGAPSVHSR